jgi:hypothetical protein
VTDVQSWINKGQRTPPDWLVEHMVDKPAPNGTFMIRTKVGQEAAQARVLVGNIVFLRNGVAHTRPPAEARAFLAALDEEERIEGPASPAAVLAGRASAFGRAPKEVVEQRLVEVRGDIATLEQRKANLIATAQPQTTKPAKVKPPLGSMPTIEWVQLDRLCVDDSYQRSVETGPSRALIKRIGVQWDWRLCAPLMVSRRADGLYVIDGQHRLEGARLRSDVPQLPCCILSYSGPADEAAMFVAVNRERRAMNRLDDFHAALAAGDEEATEVRRIVETAGLTVARTTGSQTWRPGEVAFTAAIRAVLRKHGAAHVFDILEAIAIAFPDQVLVTGGALFSGLSRILISPPAGLDKERLFLSLKRFDARGWASMIEGLAGGTDRSSAMRDALLMAYEETTPTEGAQ